MSSGEPNTPPGSLSDNTLLIIMGAALSAENKQAFEYAAK